MTGVQRRWRRKGKGKRKESERGRSTEQQFQTWRTEKGEFGMGRGGEERLKLVLKTGLQVYCNWEGPHPAPPRHLLQGAGSLNSASDLVFIALMGERLLDSFRGLAWLGKRAPASRRLWQPARRNPPPPPAKHTRAPRGEARPAPSAPASPPLLPVNWGNVKPEGRNCGNFYFCCLGMKFGREFALNSNSFEFPTKVT